jgi:hypothetical protein
MTEMAFGYGNMVAMLGWLALTVASFSSSLRPRIVPAVRLGIPLFFAMAYAVLLMAGAEAFQNGGGFSSIAQVRALFLNDEALTAGWLHYLAFDLFVGAWIVDDGRQRGVPGALLLPCLFLTFMFGPVGFAAYMLARAARREGGPKTGVFYTLFARQPILASYGFVLLLGTFLMLVLQQTDSRALDGMNIWVKPTKFFLSIAVYSLTLAWFFGYVREERSKHPLMDFVVWSTVLMLSFELFWITWQAAHGTHSHFNSATAITSLMYALMGIAIIIAIAALPVMAWEIARRPAAGLRPDYVAAVVLGLVLSFLLGGSFAGYMASYPTGHIVGAEGGHFPLLGWNRSGGDLRVAHFFGLHLQQVLPLLAALVAPLPTFWRWFALATGTIAGIALTVLVFLQALAGQPFLAGVG